MINEISLLDKTPKIDKVPTVIKDPLVIKVLIVIRVLIVLHKYFLKALSSNIFLFYFMILGVFTLVFFVKFILLLTFKHIPD